MEEEEEREITACNEVSRPLALCTSSDPAQVCRKSI